MDNNEFLPKYALNQLADRVALKVDYFDRFYNYDHIWTTRIIDYCKTIEKEHRDVNTVIVETKKDSPVILGGSGIRRHHTMLTLIYILLYYKHRDEDRYKTLVFPRLIENMGRFNSEQVLKHEINIVINRIIEEDKLAESALPEDTSTTQAAREATLAPTESTDVKANSAEPQEDTAKQKVEAQEEIAKLEAEIARLKQERTDILVELLKPAFFDSEESVREFLKGIEHLQDKEITDLVYEWAKGPDRRISYKSWNVPIWRPLHAFKYYTKSKQNWDTALRTHPALDNSRR